MSLITGATGATIHRNGLVMHLPLRLAAALRIAEPCDVDTAIAAAQGWLRQALPGRLPRLSRLARALADGLAAVGEDAAVVASFWRLVCLAFRSASTFLLRLR